MSSYVISSLNQIDIAFFKHCYMKIMAFIEDYRFFVKRRKINTLFKELGFFSSIYITIKMYGAHFYCLTLNIVSFNMFNFMHERALLSLLKTKRDREKFVCYKCSKFSHVSKIKCQMVINAS